jgi:hypothetical protein
MAYNKMDEFLRKGVIVKFVLAFIIILLVAFPLMAQEDAPAAEPISYDSTVEDSITSVAIYDWWYVQAAEGDQMVINMQATAGLAPLIGILDVNGDLVARSQDGEPNGLVTVEYTVPADGEYRIVATRVGNENGTTTGDYQLRMRRANPPVESVNPYQEVTFRCKDFEVTNAAVLEFSDDPDQLDFYRINVYGMDGFVPVIRVYMASQDVTDCAQDFQAMDGDTYTLPGQDTVTVTSDLLNYASQLTIRGAKDAGTVTLTVGSKDGSTGHFLVVVEGFTINPERDTEYIQVGQGPLAGLTPLLVYMVAGKNERLDPSMRLLSDDPESEGIICDDAGRRGCDDVPSVNGLKVHVSVDDVDIEGGRFDAGVLLPRGATELRGIELSSFSGNTQGKYSLVLMGELPPRE